VLQMSMVLRDTLFSEHSFEDWNDVVGPKIQGTWNLHNALAANSGLEFFVMFSSISGIMGTRGQAAYAAANTFLDAFVSYRHGLGLPASSMDIGPMSDVGYLTNQANLQELLKAQGLHMLKENDLLQALQFSIANGVPDGASRKKKVSHLLIGLKSSKALDDPTNRTAWRNDMRMAMYHNTATNASTDASSSTSASELKTFLSSVEIDSTLLDQASSTEFLAILIGTQIYIFMMRPVDELDVEQSLAGLGVDSLVTIEIRNWWRRSLGLEASILEILGALRIGAGATIA